MANIVPILLRAFTVSMVSALGYQFWCRYKAGEYSDNSWAPLFALCFAGYAWRIFAMHAGGHRYFSHESFKCPAWLATLFAVTITETELGMVWYWVFFHNEHHMTCDKEVDFHSPVFNGFWAVQWGVTDGFVEIADKALNMFGPGAPRNEVMRTRFSADLSWLNIYAAAAIHLGSPVLWGLLGYHLGYYPADFIFFGNVLPRFMTVQAAALTNSAAHMFGPRPYTGNGHNPFPECMATNCWWAALLNGGEGWHNNHHAFCKSARHGLLWYEVDVVWMLLRVMAHFGLIWDVIECSDEVLRTPRNPGVEQTFKNKYKVIYPKKKEL